MANMVWKDEYSVGNEYLDAQHRGLIELTNRLDGDEPLDRLLKELVHYAGTHFHDEERLLEAVNYPGLAEQRSQHKAFRTWLDGISGAHPSGDGSSAARRDLHAYLRVWIANHLLVYDAAFKSWLDESAVPE